MPRCSCGPMAAGVIDSPLPLDARLRDLLRGLPADQAAVVGALVRDRDRLIALAEQATEAARELSTAFDALDGGMMVVGVDGRITRHNRKLAAFASPGDDVPLTGRTFYDVLLREARVIGPDDPLGAAIWRHVAVRWTVRQEWSGRQFDIVASPHPAGGAVIMVDDVTESRARERALLDQVVRREKLAALGELVGGVAHEVNSPLTSILAFGQILQASRTGDDASRRAVNTIVNEARRAARIVEKFLTFARQQPTEKMRTNVNQVLLDTIELRRYPLRMQQIALDLELAEDLPAIWADPLQLQQVFINLVNNAEQALASESGPRRIVVRSEKRNDELVISVTDSGPGIASEHLPHIFNPFYTTKARGVGTGLGLSISFGIVRDHGGIVRVHSEPGQGASFEVSLPIVAPPTAS
jgi:two-component system NtrC family sensor kinase